ncbi:hexokinase type 2-like isoform X2 [Mizuhopecten yessoensis]|uniref:hexokinase type 2-like isoform X2 n=1 Tax=Mizuhopecten yessoensis TaxID=6573 RepID=UPI000B4584B7|nr:hexokinase type 2-like isoform X2 [Mizuhopecten yessoensis]
MAASPDQLPVMSEDKSASSLKAEALLDAAKKMMAPEYQAIVQQLLQAMPGQEEMLIENIVRPFILSDDDYKEIMQRMRQKFDEGLGKETNPTASVKMFTTYVRGVPDGSENGEFLALDLGGTNFRVLLISLDGQEVKMESKIFLIPQQIMLGSGIQLFDHIAECIFKFMKEHNIIHKKIPLGFTFSFPCKQLGLNKAILAHWTKGFKCEGVEGEDIVRLLHEAIQRRGDIEVECLAVINDTVGALMSCAHSNRKCAVGLILGTGTNACYIEKIDNVELWDGDDEEPREVMINTEWGAFGDDGALDFIKTDYDRKVDKTSINAGKQTYEKMISGMYMGEIVRLLLEKLRKGGHLFGGKGSEEMSTRGRFYTKYVSEIESDVDEHFKNTKQVFEELNIEKYTDEDCRIAQYVCSLISTRAAYLAAAGIGCILNKMQRPEVTVAVDGSLYRFHPHFHDLMVEKLNQIVDPGIKFKLTLSHDGSGKGAAIVTAVAHRIRQTKSSNQLDQLAKDVQKQNLEGH